MGLFDSFFGRGRTSRDAMPHPAPEPIGSESQVDVVAAMAQRIVDVINESMQIANVSKNVETRRSRIGVARDRLADLQKMASDYPFLALTNLADVERSIAELERETAEMAPAVHRSPTFAVLGDPNALHPHEVTPSHPMADLFVGMEFSATLNIATPLRLLRRDGHVVPLGTPLAHDFDRSMGHWFPLPKRTALEEAFPGISADIDATSMRASSAGPVKTSDYLPFLIAVREAVEDPRGGTSGRMARLHEACAPAAFTRFVAAEHGVARMCDRYFPPVLSLIGGLPSVSRQALVMLGITTVAKLRNAADGTLLTLKGVGPSRVAALREFCASYEGDPNAERAVDLVL
jgi:hypothetical protein